MLYKESKLQIVDNSGGKWVKCISVRKKGKNPVATTGMLILIVLKKISIKKKLKKRIRYIGLVVSTSYWILRFDGTFIKFFSNRVLLFNKNFKFLGTRIYGSVLKEIKINNLKNKKNQKYFHKVFSYSLR
jgi:large subunit ribosomal protein L14